MSESHSDAALNFENNIMPQVIFCKCNLLQLISIHSAGCYFGSTLQVHYLTCLLFTIRSPKKKSKIKKLTCRRK